MRKQLKYFMLVVFLLTIAVEAIAFVEFHSHYGSGGGVPTTYNNAYYKFQDSPKISKQSFLGFDAIARFSAFPLRFGIRYEAIGEKHTKYGEELQLSASRFSGVLNLRFINTKVYLGVIGTYGFSHQLQIELPNSDENLSTSSGSSKSFGLEGGVKFGPLRLGAEVGQLYLDFTNLKNKQGTVPVQNGITVGEIDLSAPYYKLIVGVGF